MKYLFTPKINFDATFDEDQELRHVQMDDHQLQTWDTYTTDPRGKSRIAYRLTHHVSEDDVRVVFEGNDFFVSPIIPIDSNAAIRSLLGFLTLRVGDTDDEYFETYTAGQLEWAESEAEDLSWWALDPQDDFQPPPFINLDNFDGDDDDD